MRRPFGVHTPFRVCLSINAEKVAPTQNQTFTQINVNSKSVQGFSRSSANRKSVGNPSNWMSARCQSRTYSSAASLIFFRIRGPLDLDDSESSRVRGEVALDDQALVLTGLKHVGTDYRKPMPGPLVKLPAEPSVSEQDTTPMPSLQQLCYQPCSALRPSSMAGWVHRAKFAAECRGHKWHKRWLLLVSSYLFIYRSPHVRVCV